MYVLYFVAKNADIKPSYKFICRLKGNFILLTAFTEEWNILNKTVEYGQFLELINKINSITKWEKN